MADNIETNNTVLTLCRPPRIFRLPLCLPLSRFIGAIPTSAAISFRFGCPGSGRSLRGIGEHFADTLNTDELINTFLVMRYFSDWLVELLINTGDFFGD